MSRMQVNGSAARRCVVVGGAEINDTETIRGCLRGDDFVIACDCGLRHMASLGIKPDLIVGDFDSYENPRADVETIVLPREKDDTDTFFAAKEALKRGFDDFLLLGVVGERLDHTLANLSILLYLDARGKRAVILDDRSEMEIVSGKPTFISDRYAYFSLLNITGVAEGVTIRRAKFPLENGAITCEYQYAVSNETLPGQTAEVSLTRGKLLLIKDR